MSAKGGAGIRVAEVAWPEIERRLEGGAIAVLPIGASSKEHGRHLPMDTDYRQAEWLGAELAARAPVVVWPTLGYGYYPAFIEYPGSCSIAADSFRAIVGELLGCLHRAGSRHSLILNTGISTIAPLQTLLSESPVPGPRSTLVNVYDGARYRAAAATLERQRRGGHADELETSIMLAIAPEAVAMDRAEACDSHEIRGVFNRTDPAAPNHSPSGVYGDPTQASAEKGHQLLQAMLEDLRTAVERIGTGPGPAL
ncbi:MAG: creatininase family protein [Chromatiales bacterium]|jgi:creatinine amidohydrolase